MSISTNIDGSTVSGTDDVLSLISLISDPVAYKKKIDALNAATDENRKFVELVAPAKDIIVLRDKAKVELDEAVDLKKKAQADADAQFAAAQSAVAKIIDDANSKAAGIIASAEAAKAEADATAAEASKNLAAMKNERAALTKATKEANAARDAANAEKEDAEAAKAAVVSERNALIAKNKAFIESIT